MRISATTLEAYRLWREQDPDDEWMSEAELIATITDEAIRTLPMQIGLSYHAILEHPEPCRTLWGGYEHDGILFDSEPVDQMLERIQPGVFEVKTTASLAVPGAGMITLVAKADHLVGLHCDEFKTTLSGFDAAKYMDSYQWRVMVLLFGCTSVSYHIALIKEGEKAIALKSIESFDVYPYADLERDVRSLLREFVHYVNLRGLDGFLRQRQWIMEKAEV